MAKLRKLEVIVSETHRGLGKENDPIRIVKQFFTPEGGFIGEYDPTKDEVYGAILMVEFLSGEKIKGD